MFCPVATLVRQAVRMVRGPTVGLQALLLGSLFWTSWSFLPAGRLPISVARSQPAKWSTVPLQARGGFAGKKKAGGGAGGKQKASRLRVIDEVGSARVVVGRTDFPPDPDLIFPSSEDYILTLTAEVAGKNRTFTLDTTASVNLITEEVAKDLRQPANKKASRSKGFQSARVEEDETDMLLQNDDEVVSMEMRLASEPSVGVVTRAVVSDDWGGAGDGCLGLPFLKQFGALDMDLRTLDTTITGPAANAMGLLSTDSRPARRWSVDFAPLSAMAGMEDEEAEMPEVWVIDVHVDGSNQTIPAIVDIGSQASFLNWKAGRALGYRIKDSKTVEDKAGQARVDVIFTEPTELSLGQAGRIVVPKRSLAVADLPVFEYAGLQDAPAMVIGLDVLGAGRRLVLDFVGKELSLEGPLLAPKLRKADLEVPLVVQESVEEGEELPPFGMPRQYGVPVDLGEEIEAVFMLDTAAVGTVVTKEAYDLYESVQQEQQEQEGGEEEEGGEEAAMDVGEEVVVEEEDEEGDISMSGVGGQLQGLQAELDMTIGRTELRAGYPLLADAAVVIGISTNFDGIFGLTFFHHFGVADFDFRHRAVRFYKRSTDKEGEEDEEEGGLLEQPAAAALDAKEPELDYWPPSSPVSPVPLNLGLPSKLAAFAVAPGEQAPELVGADFFLWVEVYLNGRTDVPIYGLLDTGGQTSVLNEAAAKALGLAASDVQESQFKALGLDQQPIALKYAYFKDIRLGPQQVPGRNLAIADLPGLARVGLLDRPAMLVGMDVLDGGRNGRLIIDIERRRLTVYSE